MELFSGLKQELQEYLSPDQIQQIYNAYQFAAQAHDGQQRHSGDPYITHPVAVAKILAQMRMDQQTLIVAILHDVIEDTAIEKNVLTVTFGSEIAELVDGLSKLTQIQFQSRAEAQAENFRKMLLAMAKDIRVILIKLADRLHNMRTLAVVPAKKRQRIARETLDIYAPIAQRLGMHALRIELEDLCLLSLYPWRYRILHTTLQKTRRKRKTLLSKIEADLRACLQYHHVQPSEIWHKKKHLYPIYKKMHDNHLTFHEIIDVPIFCIIVDSVDSCYRVLGAVHNLYKPLPDHFHDYIALPKANGYQALHTTLFGPATSIHIQIRTIAMDNCAEHGVVSYWLDQKNKGNALQPHLRAREWLRRLLDIQKATPSSLEFIETVKIDLFPSEIYIFTPKGDIIELPLKATPVDFAYAIHSDIGNHCISARIDKQLNPLSNPLQSGQTVEIIIDTKALPDLRWLDFVATGRARSHIRQFFKTKQHNEAVQLGQRLLDNTLLPLGKDTAHLTEKHLKRTLAQFHYASFEDLLEAIGLGYTHPLLFVSTLCNLKTISKKENLRALPLFLKNTDNSLITLSECCRPIPDDEIIGLLNAGHGLTVHLPRCQYAVRLLKKTHELNIPLQWEKMTEGSFKTDIHIETLNERGVLAHLAHQIAKANANIDNVNVENRDRQHCVVHCTVSIKNRKHLAKVIRLLRTVKTTVKISRHR